MLQHLHTANRQAIFVKLDFKKAFDSVSWTFLEKVLEAHGFHPKWIRWTIRLLSTASSRVVINGKPSEYFAHKRGLRQGDPMSSMLFNIVSDMLQRLIAAANSTLPVALSQRVPESILGFQYAGDTTIIANASVDTVVTLRIILHLFSKASGLEINYEKSTLVPINIQSQQLLVINGILGCTNSDFLVVYLGMPLTIKRPARHLFMPLIESLEKWVEGWKKRLISKGGRL